MIWRRKPGYGPAQQALAWGGLLLMLVSFVWWQSRPRIEGLADGRAPRPQDNRVVCVVIDAGHGGLDSGAIRDGVQEKDLTLDVARRVQKLAVERGFVTVMTRSADETVPLATRAAIANREEGCVFVSIHFDKGSRVAATGVQTFYAIRQVAREQNAPSWLPFLQRVSTNPVNANAESQSLAAFVQEEMVGRTGAFDRGTRAEQFYVVSNVRHPAVLVEGGFLSNTGDVARLVTESYRQELAIAISDALVRYRDMVNQRQVAVIDDIPRS